VEEVLLLKEEDFWIDSLCSVVCGFEKERDEYAFLMHVCGGAVAIASLHSIFQEEHRWRAACLLMELATQK
jgi:hypothetical protein